MSARPPPSMSPKAARKRQRSAPSVGVREAAPVADRRIESRPAAGRAVSAAPRCGSPPTKRAPSSGSATAAATGSSSHPGATSVRAGAGSARAGVPGREAGSGLLAPALRGAARGVARSGADGAARAGTVRATATTVGAGDVGPTTSSPRGGPSLPPSGLRRSEWLAELPRRTRIPFNRRRRPGFPAERTPDPSRERIRGGRTLLPFRWGATRRATLRGPTSRPRARPRALGSRADR